VTSLLLLVGRSLPSPPSSVGVDPIAIVDASSLLLLLLLLLLSLLLLLLMRRRCLLPTPALVQRVLQIVGVYAAAELPPPVAVAMGLVEIGPPTGISKIVPMMQPLRRRPDAGVAPRGGRHSTGGGLAPIRTHATTTAVAVIDSIVVIAIVE
jgi:hypothetical protein